MKQRKKQNRKKSVPLLSAALMLCLAMSGCAQSSAVAVNALPAEQNETQESFGVADIRPVQRKRAYEYGDTPGRQSAGTFDSVRLDSGRLTG